MKKLTALALSAALIMQMLFSGGSAMIRVSAGSLRTTVSQSDLPGDDQTVTPSDVTPSDVTPSDVTPSDVTPSDVTPSDVTPSDVTPSDVTPSDVTPSDVTPSDVTPSDVTPSDTQELEILSDPDDVIAVIGDTAVFRVTAKGEGLSFRWQLGGGDDWSDLAVESSDSGTLTVTVSEEYRNRSFRCVVTDSAGRSAVSGEARLTIVNGAAITSDPSDVSGEEGGEAVFTVAATGDGLTYQWQRQAPSGGDWEDISDLDGCASNELTVPETYENDGFRFRCVVTDMYGRRAESASALLTVKVALTILTQPQPQSAVVNGTATFTIKARGNGLTYQWQQLKTAEGSSWVSISSYEGCKTDTMKAPAWEGRDGYQYRCVVSDSRGVTVTSDAVTMTLLPAVSITKDTEDVTAELFGEVVFHVEASGTGLHYQWQLYDTSQEKWMAVSSDYLGEISGANTDTMTFRADPLLENKYPIRCAVTDAGGNVARSKPVNFTLSGSGGNSTISAESFGADGSDSASDRKTIQAALDFAGRYATAETPITVTLGEGTFYVENALLISSHTRFVLSDATTLAYAGTEGCIIQGGDGTQASYDTLTDVVISGGLWKGNAAATGAHTEPIGFKSANHITIAGLRMEDSSDHFIMLTGVRDSVVRDCSFRDHFKLSTIDQFTKEAVHIDLLPLDENTLFPSRDITVERCTFDNVASGIGTHNYGYGQYETNITVKDCTFRNLLYNCVNAHSMINLSVADCTAENCGSFLWMSDSSGTFTSDIVNGCGTRGFSVLDGSTCTIRNCTVSRVGSVAVEGGESDTVESGAPARSIAILVRDSVGVIEDNTINGVQGVGIRVKNGNSLSHVSGNRVSDATEQGIYVSNDRITVSGNTLRDCQGIWSEFGESEIYGNTVSRSLYGISDYCGKAHIYENAITGSTETGIQINGTAEQNGQAVIENNVISDSDLCDVRIGSNCSGCVVKNNNTELPFTFLYSRRSDITASGNGLNPPPETPVVSCEVSGTLVILRWEEAEGASRYEVYRYLPDTNEISRVAVTDQLSYQVTGLDGGTQYHFLVVSYDGNDVPCVFTYPTNAVSATTSGVSEPPQIIAQPQSVTARAGDELVFSVRASGSGLRYQWYYKKAGALGWSVWKGHTSAVTQAPANPSWHGMQLRCEVTDSEGRTVTSEPAEITLLSSLEITMQSEDVEARVGGIVSFSVAAKGDELRYQWYYKKAGAVGWSLWKGHNTASTSAAANASWMGMQVYCVVTDAYGNTVSSRPVTITVSQPLRIVSEPADAVAEVGSTVTFTVRADGIGLCYQWYYKKAGAADWSLWKGHTTNSTSAPANISWDGMKVYCRVTDQTGAAVDSREATIRVHQELRITLQPQNVTVASGDNAKFTVRAEGVGLTYQWYFKKADSSEWRVWKGHTTASTSAPSNDSWHGMQLYCRVTDSGGAYVDSSAATVTVTKPLAILSQPQNVTAAPGDEVNFLVGASGLGLRYQWYYKKAGAVGWSLWKGHTAALTSAVANATWDGMQVYCLVTDVDGASVSSEPAVITLAQDLEIISQPAPVGASVGDEVSFTVKAKGLKLSYQWYYKKAGASVWNLWKGHTTATTGAVANATWNGMQVYCVVTDGEGHTAASEPALITLR